MRAVFVSSTFKDMQFERDMLNIRVVPRINDFLSKYAENVHFGDLRWGINTTELESEASSKKILKVCLDQIDDCKPYMIVFIGERYGWIPSKELLHQAMLVKGMNDASLVDESSVTELEIEYGALLDPDFEGRILFYFRNPFDMSKMTEEEKNNFKVESPLHLEKITKLKEKILSKYEKYVRYYDVSFNEKTRVLDGLDKLSDQIYEDLKRIFDIDLTYINSLPSEVRTMNNSINHFNKLAENSYIRLDYSKINNNDSSIFEVIEGEPGVGAKTITAQKYLDASNKNYDTFAFSYGLDNFTNDLNCFTKSLIYKLEDLLKINHDNNESIKYLGKLLLEYSTNIDNYLHVFAINMPRTFLKLMHELEIYTGCVNNVYFHIHFKDKLDDNIPLPYFTKNKVLEILNLKEDEIRGVIQSILKSKRKELSDIVIDEIIKHKYSNNALYLSLLIERLMMLDNEDFSNIKSLGDGMDSINKYMIQIIRDAGDDIEDISHNLLKELSERINKKMIPHLISHITLDKHFNDDGIGKFFNYCGYEFNYLDYILFKKTIPSLFYNTLNNIFYATNDIKRGAVRVLNDLGYESHILKVIDYLMNNKIEDAIISIIKMLYVNNDAIMFFDFCQRYLDIELIEIYNKEPSDKYLLFKKAYETFTSLMNDSYSDKNEFSKDVIKCFVDKIINDEIKNPYTLISIIHSYITIDYSNIESIIDSFLYIKELLDYMEKVNSLNKTEIKIFAYILRITYIESMLYYLSNTSYDKKIKEEYFKIMLNNASCKDIINVLVRSNKLYITSASNIKILAYMNMYKMNKDSLSDMEKFNLVTTANKVISIIDKEENFIYNILKNNLTLFNKQEIKETIIGLLLIVGRKYYLEEKYDEASNYYNAIYSLFSNYYKTAIIDYTYISTIVYVMTEYLEYAKNTLKKNDFKKKYDEIIDWIMNIQAINYKNIDVLFNAMNVLNMNKVNKKSEYYFTILLGKILKLIELNKDPFSIYNVIDTFINFSYILDDVVKVSSFTYLMAKFIVSLIDVEGYNIQKTCDILRNLNDKFIKKNAIKVNIFELVINRLVDNSSLKQRQIDMLKNELCS